MHRYHLFISANEKFLYNIGTQEAPPHACPKKIATIKIELNRFGNLITKTKIEIMYNTNDAIKYIGPIVSNNFPMGLDS